MKTTLLTAIIVAMLAPTAALAAPPKGKMPAHVRTVRKPHVFNLVNKAGHFETSSQGQRTGWRTFGLWSYREPKKGDVVVKRGNDHRGNLTIWEIERVDVKPFTGSNGESFWNGLMRDLVQTRTLQQKHLDAVNEAARTQPELLPKQR